LGADVSIPNDYISETAQRLRTYKRISSADSDSALQQIYAEIGDRYGKIPASVDNLFDYARLRKSAEQMRVVSIDKTREGFAIKLGETRKSRPKN
jgi:transcription-repair coupling factor (superfamily II helicase)